MRSPSSLSVAVTSFFGSNVSPTVSVLSSALIVGTSFNFSIFGLTVTVIVFVVDAPSLSVTLYVTSYVPAFVMSTVFLAISILAVRSPSSLSVAATSFFGSNVSPTISVLSSALISGTLFNGSILFFHVATYVVEALTVSLISGVHPVKRYPVLSGVPLKEGVSAP